MKKTWTVWLSVAFAGFIAGFIVILALHRQIRPDAEIIQSTESIIPEQLSPVSQTEFDEVKATLSSIETEYEKAKESHNITEGHARALMAEMQVYRTSESELLKSIEQQKEALTDKIESLELQISEAVAMSAQKPVVYDYDLVNEINALLAYPHPLNSNPILNKALAKQPMQGIKLVNARFEIMLQPEHYPHTDAVYDALEKLIEAQPQEAPEITIENVFCSESQCELQFKVAKPSPYFDSWRWLLDQLSGQPALVAISSDFFVESSESVSGLVMLTPPR